MGDIPSGNNVGKATVEADCFKLPRTGVPPVPPEPRDHDGVNPVEPWPPYEPPIPVPPVDPEPDYECECRIVLYKRGKASERRFTRAGRRCIEYTHTFQQQCVPVDSQGNPPHIPDYFAVLSILNNLVNAGLAEDVKFKGKLGGKCKDTKTGKCTEPCDLITIQYTTCKPVEVDPECICVVTDYSWQSEQYPGEDCPEGKGKEISKRVNWVFTQECQAGGTNNPEYEKALKECEGADIVEKVRVGVGNADPGDACGGLVGKDPGDCDAGQCPEIQLTCTWCDKKPPISRPDKNWVPGKVFKWWCKYARTSHSTCVEDVNKVGEGPYDTQGECENECTKTGEKFKCISPGFCNEDPNGTYDTWNKCIKSEECQPPSYGEVIAPATHGEVLPPSTFVSDSSVPTKGSCCGNNTPREIDSPAGNPMWHHLVPDFTGNSNLPSEVISPSESGEEANSIVRIESSYGSNQPHAVEEGEAAQKSISKYIENVPHTNQRFKLKDPRLDTFINNKNNLTAIKDAEVLQLVNTFSPPGRELDPHSRLLPQIPTPLMDILKMKGENHVPFNGTTLTFLLTGLHNEVFKTVLSESTQTFLDKVNESNISSLYLSDIMLQTFKQAILQGKMSQYSDSLLNDMLQSGKVLFPDGTPTGTFRMQRSMRANMAKQLLLNKGLTLLPLNFPSDGNAIRETMLYYLLPEYIRLQQPILPRGKDSNILTNYEGVRFYNTNQLYVAPRDEDNSTSGVFHKYECLRVIKRNGTEVAAPGASDRDKAFSYKSHERAMILGLLAEPFRGGGSLTHLDVEAQDSTLEQASVDASTNVFLFTPNFSSVAETTDPPNQLEDNNYLNLSATYNLVWSSTDSNYTTPDHIPEFSGYYGPSRNLYVPQNDNIVNYLLKAPSVDFTFTDLNPDIFNGLGDRVYPPSFPMSIFITLTDSVRYSPFLGRSRLVSYTNDKQKRRMAFAPSPFLTESRQKFSYPVEDATKQGPDLKPDAFAFSFKYQSDFLSDVYSQSSYTTQQSFFGKVLDRITQIDTAYTLPRELGKKILLSIDLWRFFKGYEIIEYISNVPRDVQLKVTNGILNDIKIRDAKNKDTPITASDSEAIWTTPPLLNYFSNSQLNCC